MHGRRLFKHVTQLHELCSALLIGVLVVLAGCSGPPPASVTLTPAHVAGVRMIPAVAQWQQQHNYHGISALTTFRPPAATANHALFASGAGMLDVDLSSGALTPQAHAPGCFRQISMAPDGIRGVCHTDEGIAFFTLTMTSTGRMEVTQNSLVITAPPGARSPSTPTWSSDGKWVAAITGAGHGCSIGIYAPNMTGAPFRLMGLFTLDAYFTTIGSPPGCSASQLAWSPDETWLSLIGPENGGPSGTVYAVNMRAFLPQLLRAAANNTVLTVSVTAAMLIDLRQSGVSLIYTWGPTAETITTSSSADGKDLEVINIKTGQKTPLFSQQNGEIETCAWTPDHRAVVFTLGQPAGDVELADVQMYVYTPSHPLT